MTAADPRKAKFAKRCPRCGYDEWHVMRQHRQCAKCGWKEITVMPVPANAFYQWKPRPPMCKLCGAAIIGILVNDPAPEYCAACRIISVPILPRNPNGLTAEKVRKEAQAAIDQVAKVLSECRPELYRSDDGNVYEITATEFVPSTSWADGTSCNPLDDVEKMYREGVFCGTTGDKEHVKDKALRQPLGPEPDTRCSHCSRLEATWRSEQDDYVCSTCFKIAQKDAPLAAHLPKDEATSLWLKIDHERAKLANARALLGNA